MAWHYVRRGLGTQLTWRILFVTCSVNWNESLPKKKRIRKYFFLPQKIGYLLYKMKQKNQSWKILLPCKILLFQKLMARKVKTFNKALYNAQCDLAFLRTRTSTLCLERAWKMIDFWNLWCRSAIAIVLFIITSSVLRGNEFRNIDCARAKFGAWDPKFRGERDVLKSR